MLGVQVYKVRKFYYRLKVGVGYFNRENLDFYVKYGWNGQESYI